MATPEDGQSVEERLQSEVMRLTAELEEQKFARELVEVNAQKLREDRDNFSSRLRKAERAQMMSDMQVRTLTSELTSEDVVKSLVNVELGQFKSCSHEERVATKRRLLLRWHPDKNSGSGSGGSDLATRVVQEMQSRSEWNEKA